ncbi:sugar ABC transporter permease, partial [Streptomyces sp. MCAF7]
MKPAESVKSADGINGIKRTGTTRPANTTKRAGRPPREYPYALFLIPGALAFLVVIVVPFLMNTGLSFTHWQG